MTVRDEIAEPEGPEAHSCSPSQACGASPPPAGLSKQRIGECGRSVHESCGLEQDQWSSLSEALT